MINAIEYATMHGGIRYALAADKNMAKRNAWHLKSISGNGLPPVTAFGEQSYGIAGRSYGGLMVEGREIELELYADGYSAFGCQLLVSDAGRVLTPANDALGVLSLTNAAGESYRIAAKAIAFDVDETKRRSMLINAVFDCPYSYFESYTEYRLPLFAVHGGKEYVEGSGLERPYTFGNIEVGEKDQTLNVFNGGDVPAPVKFRIFGAGLSRVEIVNETTGKNIIVSGMNVGGIEIDTDVNSASATFDDGSDASRFVSLYSEISEFVLMPGNNVVNVKMTASSITAAGTEITWRGRYSTCL